MFKLAGGNQRALSSAGLSTVLAAPVRRRPFHSISRKLQSLIPMDT
jgi:hypothetical protein